MADLPVSPSVGTNLGTQNPNSRTQPGVTQSGTTSIGKEVEVIGAGAPTYSEMTGDVEVERGLEGYIQKTSETIDLPPDVRKMGVTQVGPAAQLQPSTTAVSLPISDMRIEQGLHAPLLSNLRWLAEFCLRQLKRAHLHLKKLAGGSVVREADK